MKKQILIIILLLFNSIVGFIPVDDNTVQIDDIDIDTTRSVVTTAFYPDDIGYEFLNDGDILHIWNTEDNYYFDVDSGIQFTNHYMRYWTHNVMMLGYYAGDTWNLLYRTDELSGFSKNIDTDNSTYINITMWKDLSYGSYDFRLAIVYYLELNDRNLTVIPYIKNLGIEIPYTLAFGWELKDIQVDMTEEYDQIYVNNETSYLLNQTLDESYTGSDTDGVFYLQNNNSGNVNKDLYLRWNPSLDYLLKVKSRDGQYNAPVTLFIRIGTLNVGQEKFTKMYWHDSTETIRSDSTGVINEWDYQNAGAGSSPNNYNRVDEAIQDGDTTRVACGTDGSRDAYNFDDTTSAGTITNVEVHYYAKHATIHNDGRIRAICYVSGTYYYGNWEQPVYGSYNYYDTDTLWAANPSTPGAWTWDEVDDAQFGYEGERNTGYPQVTQIYVTIEYTPDTTAPTPNPLTWSSEPSPDSTTAISMTSTTATDDYYPSNELSYQFNETIEHAGATDSGWQLNDVTYTDSGLSENTNYTYHCRVRDGMTPPNVGGYSSDVTVYTLANPPSDAEFLIDTYESSWMNMSVLDVNNYPTSDLTGAYFECVTGSGDGGIDSGWVNLTSSGRYYYNTSGLDGGTTFGYKVKYRNGDGTATTYTSEKQETTTYELRYNETTDIGASSATFHGHMVDDPVYNGNYNCVFWYGLSEDQDGSDGNVSSGIYARGDAFTAIPIDLTEGTTYYVRAYVYNATSSFTSSEKSFSTRPASPLNLALTATGDSGISISWMRNTTNVIATTVVIRNSSGYPTNASNGTIVYNGTNSLFVDTDTALNGAIIYYRIWNHLNPFSESYSEANITLPPLPPTNIDTNVLANNTFDITWTTGVGANTTLVRRKLNGYSSSVTDGTEVYNDTGTQLNIQDISSDYYYSFWSYANDTYSSSMNLTVGGLVINCYDENTNDALWFDVFISNQDGSQSYESCNNSNSLILNLSQLPTGDNIKITVSAASNYSEKSEVSSWSVNENYTITYIVLSQIPDSKSTTNVTCINVSNGHHSYPPFTLDADLVTILPDDADDFTKIFVNYTHEEYGSRLYYRDIVDPSFSILNTYLPPTEDKQLYLLEVIDEASNTVSDAYIDVKRSVNGTFVVVSSLLTDANGQADIDLISGKNYIFIISKDGYVTENASWTPSDRLYHTFKLIWETTPFEPDTFGDIINFYGTLYVNNTMRVSFYDLDNVMIDSHFTIYEDYNGTLTYMGEYNGTTSNDITFWINVSNATRLHIIILYMNHSTLGEVINYRIFVYPVHIDRDEGNWFEVLIQSVVGDFDYGYVISFIWYLPCVLLVVGMASIKHPGTGILAAGLYSVWITWYIDFSIEAKILAFASIALVTGFITLFLVKGKEAIH